MLRLKPKFDPLSKVQDFWDSLDVAVVANKRELFLGFTTCVLSGLVVGMLISPKKQVSIGSNNGSNNCDNVSTASLHGDSDPEDAENGDEK